MSSIWVHSSVMFNKCQKDNSRPKLWNAHVWRVLYSRRLSGVKARQWDCFWCSAENDGFFYYRTTVWQHSSCWQGSISTSVLWGGLGAPVSLRAHFKAVLATRSRAFPFCFWDKMHLTTFKFWTVCAAWSYVIRLSLSQSRRWVTVTKIAAGRRSNKVRRRRSCDASSRGPLRQTIGQEPPTAIFKHG